MQGQFYIEIASTTLDCTGLDRVNPREGQSYTSLCNRWLAAPGMCQAIIESSDTHYTYYHTHGPIPSYGADTIENPWNHVTIEP